MKSPLIVRMKAKRDIREGRSFMDSRQNGLGSEFAQEVHATLHRIAEMPEIYGEIEDGVRVAGTNRFGDFVYYRIAKNRVEVLAILHGSRDSSIWKSRI